MITAGQAISQGIDKIVGLGDSVMKGIGYGGVTATDTFLYKIGIASGYLATNIINSGKSSDTSAGALARLSTDVLAYSPKVCLVEIGLNDWAAGISLAVYRGNVSSILSTLKSNGIKPVGLTKMQRGTTSDFAGQKQYIEAFEAECATQGVNLVDLFREECASYLYLTSTAFYANYVDVVHLTVAGHQFVTDLAARSKFSGWFT